MAAVLSSEAGVVDGTAEVQLVELENDIGELKEKAALDHKLEMTGNDKIRYKLLTR